MENMKFSQHEQSMTIFQYAGAQATSFPHVDDLGPIDENWFEKLTKAKLDARGERTPPLTIAVFPDKTELGNVLRESQAAEGNPFICGSKTKQGVVAACDSRVTQARHVTADQQVGYGLRESAGKDYEGRLTVSHSQEKTDVKVVSGRQLKNSLLSSESRAKVNSSLVSSPREPCILNEDEVIINSLQINPDELNESNCNDKYSSDTVASNSPAQQNRPVVKNLKTKCFRSEPHLSVSQSMTKEPLILSESFNKNEVTAPSGTLVKSDPCDESGVIVSEPRNLETHVNVDKGLIVPDSQGGKGLTVLDGHDQQERMVSASQDQQNGFHSTYSHIGKILIVPDSQDKGGFTGLGLHHKRKIQKNKQNASVLPQSQVEKDLIVPDSQDKEGLVSDSQIKDNALVLTSDSKNVYPSVTQTKDGELSRANFDDEKVTAKPSYNDDQKSHVKDGLLVSDFETKDEVCVSNSQVKQDKQFVSDSWDSPRLPYTWTPGSSKSLSPDDFKPAAESRGSSKSSSPSSIAVSLGVNLEGSMLSWTSSLETPPCQSPVTKISDAVHQMMDSSSKTATKRFPRALFSPKKAEDSISGIESIAELNSEETVLEKTIVPFISSPVPLLGDEIKQPSPCKDLWTSTPSSTSQGLSPIPNSPGQLSVIESALSDFFDTPVSSGKRTRRKHAPGKKYDKASSSENTPSNVSHLGFFTPFSSPLTSILSSEKKPKTPNSAKRVRFADDMDEIQSTKKTKLSHHKAESESDEASQRKESIKDCPPSVSDEQILNDESKILDKRPRIGFGRNLKKELHDDDMFSQISEETLETMCLSCPNNEDDDVFLPTTDVRKEINLSKEVEKGSVIAVKDSCVNPLKNLSCLPSNEAKQEGITLSHRTTIASSTSSAVELKDEDMFTQISPDLMVSMINSAKKSEQLPFQGYNDINTSVEQNTPSESGIKALDIKNEIRITSARPVDKNRNHPPKYMDLVKVSASEQTIFNGNQEKNRTNSLKPTLSRKGKNRLFMYPSAQQIDKFCPKNVFSFKSADSSNVTSTPITSVIKANLKCGSSKLPVVLSSNSSPILSVECGTSKEASENPVKSGSRMQLFPPKRSFPSSKSQLSKDFKTFSEMIKDCESGLLDSSFEDDNQEHGCPEKADVQIGLVPRTLHVVKECTNGNLNVKADKIESVQSDGDLYKSNEVIEKTDGSDQLANCQFCTASGTKLQLSQESLNAAHMIVDDCLVESDQSDLVKDPSGATFHNKETQSVSSKVSEGSSVLSYQTCKPASSCGLNTHNLGIKTSASDEKSAYNSKTILQHIPKEVGFRTAGGQNVAISAMALRNAKAFVEEACDKKELSVNGNVHITGSDQMNVCGNVVGFRAVSEKSFKLNGEGLPKAKVLVDSSDIGNLPMADDLNGNRNLVGCAMKDDNDSTMTQNRNIGFSTAGGKRVKVSKASLLKAKSLVDSSDQECLLVADERKAMRNPATCSTDVEKMNGVPQNIGFSTAGGKRVKISKEALLKAKSLVDSSDQECLLVADERKAMRNPATCSTDVEKMNGVPQNIGFSTAGGKRVKISKEALLKAKSLVDSSDQECLLVADERKALGNSASCSTDVEKMNGVPQNMGFSTAGGKSVIISRESLANAKAFVGSSDADLSNNVKQKSNLLTDLATAEGNFVLPQQMPENIDCPIACGRSGNVSKKEHLKSKALENPTDMEGLPLASDFIIQRSSNEDDDFIIPQHENIGFSTASGKCVKLSKDAIRKAKELVDSSDIEHSSEEDLKRKCNSRIESATMTKGLVHLIPETMGFSTAGGKSVKLSKEALAKAKALVDSADMECLSVAEYQTSSKSERTSESERLNVEPHKSKSCKLDPKVIGNQSSTGFKTLGGFERLDSGSTFKYGTKLSRDNPVSTSVPKGFQSNIAIERVVRNISGLTCNPEKQEKGYNTEQTINSNHSACDFDTSDENILEAAMVQMTTVVDNEISERSLKRPRFSNSFSDDEAFQSELERLPKEMKMTFMTGPCQKQMHVPLSAAPKSVNNCPLAKAIRNTNENFFNSSSDKHMNVPAIDTLTGSKGLSSGMSDISVDASNSINSLMNDKHRQLLETFPQKIKVGNKKLDPNLFMDTCSVETQLITDAKDKITLNVNQEKNTLSPGLKSTRSIRPDCFQTASGKLVSVQPASILAAKHILYDFDDEKQHIGIQEVPSQQNSVVPFGGGNIQTVIGKSISFPEKSLKDSKELVKTFPVSDKNEPDKQSTEPDNLFVLHADQTGLMGSKLNHHNMKSLFQTASGKSVAVSEKALKESKAIFTSKDHIDLDYDHSFKQSTSTSIFQTASGKSVCVSEKALQEAKTAIGVDDFPNKASLHSDLNKQNYGPSSLFQTASGKSVCVSDKALQEAKAAIGVDDFPNKGALHSDRNKQNSGPSSLFQTASGMSVCVSDKALQEAKATLTESESDALCSRSYPKPSTHSSSLFQTASGKSVDFSEKALKEAKAVLTENVRDTQHGIVACQRQTLGPSNLFQTASGKLVEVSERALKEAKGILTDGEFQTVENQNLSRPSFLQTSTGNSLSVSKKALEEAKSLVEESNIDDGPALLTCESQVKSYSVNKVSCVFQSASGKDVFVSEKALEESKALVSTCTVERATCTQRLSIPDSGFVDETFIQNHSISSEGKAAVAMSSCIFQTSSGKSVTVSEEALSEVKKGLGIDANPEHSCTKTSETSSGKVNIFQTSSGKPVFVSKKALFEARNSIRKLDGTERESTIDMMHSDTISHQGQSDLSRRSNEAVSTSSHHESIQQPFGKRSLSKKLTHSNYKRIPVFSSLEESIRDHPYRKGRTFTPRRTSDVELSSPKIREPTNVTSQPGSGAVFPDKTTSIFKTPYKNEASTSVKDVTKVSSNGINTTSNRAEKQCFNPFITGPDNVSRDEREKTAMEENDEEKALCQITQDLEERGYTAMTSVNPRTPKHTPSCSGDNGTKETKDCSGSSDCKQERTTLGLLNVEQVTQRCLSKEAIAALQMARLRQDKIIMRKKRLTVKPSAGKLFNLKSSVAKERRYKLRDLQQKFPVKKYPKIKKTSLQSVTSRTSEEFSFRIQDYYGNELTDKGEGVIVGDGILLLPDDHCTAGKTEFYRAFITHENVDPKLISEQWLYNHYRWIVWKLAAYEVYYPHLFSGRCLNPDTVMSQLKYRYDREIDKCHRPAIRKITEHDDSPGKRLVLCVSDVVKATAPDASVTKDTTGKVELELTDGWYCIRANLDTALSHIVNTGRVSVGDKLFLCGAELTGSQDPSHPLETPDSVKLKLSANSVRKARWETRLGYQDNPSPFTLSLSSLLSDGGMVPALDIVVLRVYPIMYFEKTSDGRSVFRTARAEQKADATYRRGSELLMEQLYSKLQAEFQMKEESSRKGAGKPRSSRLSVSQIESLRSGAEIYEAINNAREPDSIEMCLSSHQRCLLQQYRQSIMEKKQQQLQNDFQKALKEKQEGQPERKCVPILKVRVAGCHLNDLDEKQSCMLTVWRPSEDVSNLLTEGRKLRIYSLSVSGARSRICNSEIQLTATRSTRYEPMAIDENFLDQVYEPREVLAVCDLRSQKPAYGEVDFIGIVIRIEEGESHNDRGCHFVYVADVLGEILAIRIWGSLKSLDLDDVLVCGKSFVGSNLQWRGRQWKQLIVLEMSTEISYFTQNPGTKIFTEKLNQVRLKAKDSVFLKDVRERLDDILGLTTAQSLETPIANAIGTSTAIPDLNQSLTSANTSLTETTSSAKKSLLQSKKEKLARYANAPPLSPLAAPIPPTVRKAFRPPRRQSTPV